MHIGVPRLHAEEAATLCLQMGPTPSSPFAHRSSSPGVRLRLCSRPASACSRPPLDRQIPPFSLTVPVGPCSPRGRLLQQQQYEVGTSPPTTLLGGNYRRT